MPQSVFRYAALALLVVVGACVPAPPAGEATQDHPVTVLYVARVISVSSATRDAFVACLQRNELPVWQQLKRDGLLADHSVFEVTSVRTTEATVPSWRFLFLSRLEPVVTPQAFLDAERKSLHANGKRCENALEAEVRRVETLRPTPNSYYPRATPEEDRQAQESKVGFSIEYIAVHDTPSALSEYRESMRLNMGPAMGQLIRDRWFFNFIALETVSVQFAQPGMPNWNQIHIVGYLPESTPAAMDAALRRVNPEGGGSAGFFGRLESIRTKPRQDVARELFELAVR